MITAGFSLLKSLGKPKRKRDGDESDSPGDPDTDSASKRARARASGGNGAAATKSKAAAASPSFITSSVRKTKTKAKMSKSVDGNGGDDRVERDLRARFQSVDEGEEARERRAPRSKSEKTKTGPAGRAKKSAAGAGGSGGMMGIFSPVFAYFGSAGPATRARRAAAGATGKETKTNQPRKSSSARASSSRGAAGATGAAAGGKAAPVKRKDSARDSARDSASARRTRSLATSDDDAKASDDEGSSDDDVPVARLVSPGRDARPPSRAAPRGGHAAASAESLESDEAEETESDDAVLAASRGGGAGTSAGGAYAAKASKKGSVEQNPNLAPDGTIIQNGFGKADTTLEDEYEYEDEMDESNYDEEYDPWIFIGGLPPLRSCVPKNRPRLLPPKTPVHVNKNTLVLDLDETLVHSDLEQTAGKAADFSFPVHFNNQKHVVNVKKRPFLAEFMEFAARHFEVVVFTASQRVYAERLLDTLDPDAVLVKHRLYREACVLVDGNYMKDLSAIGRDLRGVVIVDNSPQAFGFQTENGVPIESWFDDPDDAQLLKLMPLLARLAASEDVRPVLRKKFNLDARVRAAEEKAEARARAEGRQL